MRLRGFEPLTDGLEGRMLYPAELKAHYICIYGGEGGI